MEPNEEQQNNEAAELEVHRIQDFDDWLSRNALRAPSEATQRSELLRNEETQSFQEHSRYQEELHTQIFANQEEEEQNRQQERQTLIASWSAVHIEVLTSDGVLPQQVPLKPLAESCDFVFAMASSRDQFSSQDQKLQVSLDRFSSESVGEFLSVVNGDKTLPSDNAVVDCCQIAHYLQNTVILQATVDILIQSIDSANCMSLCQLADQLNLPTLFERSLSYMMQSLGDLETTGAWEDLPDELKETIGSIQTAIQSSIHSQRSRLYFSSLREYLSIFAETVQYNRERLAEAKEQHGQTTHRGGAWQDTQNKIERQERRVRTLEAVMKEQKKLFSLRKE